MFSTKGKVINEIRLFLALWLLGFNKYKCETNTNLFKQRLDKLKRMKQCI